MHIRQCLLAFLLLTVVTFEVKGEEKKELLHGVGVFWGVTSHKTEDQGDAGYNFKSEGYTLGIDYILPINDSFAITPIVATSYEWFSGDQLPEGRIDYGGHSMYALGLRYFREKLYVGLHLGLYLQRFSIDDPSFTYENVIIGEEPAWEKRTNFGPGGGIQVGFQQDSFFMAFQMDNALLAHKVTKVRIFASRFYIGHRW